MSQYFGYLGRAIKEFIMNHNIISFSFVFLLKQPVQIPMLENKFCKDLFDDPYNTDVGFTPEGFIINLGKSQVPNPHVLLGPMKADFLSDSLEQVKKIIDKIVAELNRLNVAPFEITAIGVNTEHEFLNIMETAQQYLVKRFFSGFKNTSDFTVNMTDLRFQVKKDENNFYNLLIQPRANQPNGLYININAHKQQNYSGIPTGKYLDSLYKQTEEELDRLIFPSLDLEG
jgi:hypothetical protein